MNLLIGIILRIFDKIKYSFVNKLTMKIRNEKKAKFGVGLNYSAEDVRLVLYTISVEYFKK